MRTVSIVCSFDKSDASSTSCEYCKPILLQTPTERDIPNFVLIDAHLGSMLVHRFRVKSRQHKIWLPHRPKIGVDLPPRADGDVG